MPKLAARRRSIVQEAYVVNAPPSVSRCCRAYVKGASGGLLVNTMRARSPVLCCAVPQGRPRRHLVDSSALRLPLLCHRRPAAV
eukprot:362713-Chlamydomonas_euryale.AAC.16